MNWQTHVPNIFGIGFNVTLIRFLHFSLSIILNMIILQPVSSSESSSQKSMIIGSKTFLSMQFSLQYSFSILTTCSSAFVYCIRLWTRIISMSPNRIPKKVYRWNRESSTKNSWSSEVKSMLTKCDQIDCFRENTTKRMNVKEFVHSIKQKLLEYCAIKKKKKTTTVYTLST
jgi:hypothetical protein